jgi:acetyltransferase
VECIIGSSHDVTFGPTVMFGLGGIFVEVLKDVSFRVAPINAPEAGRMVSEIKGFPLLTGVRGKKGVNIPALVEAVSKLSHMVAELTDVAEVDLNPVFATEQGIDVVDARIVLHPSRKKE